MRLVFILGSPYSGSTILGNLLNAHDGVSLIGEAERHEAFGRFPANPEHYLRHCSICATQERYACPVWPAEGLDPAAASDPAAMLRAYRRILAAAGGEVVVDSSKGVDWLRALLDAGLGGDVRAIVVARSPSAFVASNRARLPGRDVVWHAAGWRNIYQHTLRALAAQGIPQVTVRHEELVHAPEAWGARLGAFLGLDPAGFDLARVHARPAHPLGGNLRELARMRGFDREGLRRSGVAEARDLEGLAARAPDYLSPRPVLPERAEAWRDLSLEEMVAVIQTPGVVEVFNALGYSLRSFLDKAPPPPPSAG